MILRRINFSPFLGRQTTIPISSHHLPILALSYKLPVPVTPAVPAAPRFQSTMSKEFKLKGLTSLSLPPGEKQEVEVEGIEDGKVLLVNAAGSIQALGTKCTHYGAPLVKGVLTKSGRLTCPWHGACFNAKTGDVEDAPALDALPSFRVTERDGAVYITGDEPTVKSGRRKPNLQCRTASRSKPQEHKVVIVGGGSGALGAVEGLRENGYGGAMAIISKEGYRPIDRPKLSKALATDPDKIAWRDDAWFEAAAVEMIDDEVTGIDFNDRVLKTKSGDSISYTKLILSTGGTPRRLPMEGFNLDNVFTLRTIADTKKIVAAIGDKGKNIVIIGSSFIGMEVAKATCSDNNVTIVGLEKVALERVMGESVGAGLQKGLEALGVKFYMSASVVKAEASSSDASKASAVLLKDGTRLAADLIILGVGVSPATEYLRDNPAVTLEKDGSVKTDEKFAVPGLKDVYAIGDIATYPYHGPGGNGAPTRIEHWCVAQNAGRTVARAITHPDEEKARPFVPVFWSALSGQLRYCGNTAGGWDGLVLQGDTGAGKFVAYYCRGETVVAMAAMGMDPVLAQVSNLMFFDMMPSKKEIEGGLDVMTLKIQ